MRRERKNTGGNIFSRAAAWIYQKYKLSPNRSRINRDLAKLYPGTEVEALADQYYIRKLALTLTVVAAGTILAGLVAWQEWNERSLQAGNHIERGDYRKEAEEVELLAEVEGFREQEIRLEIQGKLPDKEEADLLEEQFWEELRRTALGDNHSEEQVYEELCLQRGLEGYPFTVSWSSDAPYIIDDEGNVRELTDEESCEVILTAHICLQDWEWQHTMNVTVVSPPLTEEARLYRELEAFVKEAVESAESSDGVTLPEEWQGKSVNWREQTDHQGLLLWILVLVAGAGIYFLQDKDLHTKVLERQQQLLDRYPVILNKLVLYLGAGLTIRGAFLRMAEEYQTDRTNDGEACPVYEEILCMCREFQTGAEEAEVYERFGRRCGQTEYVRLSSLLSQNLKKGSSSMLVRLTEEADNAVKEQMNRSRKRGEEVSTKLLVPMVMMLAIVMVMIMIPAFGSL